jgi:predicted transposase YdaD
MPDEWDDSIKRLFREHPQDFVSWLEAGAIYLGTVSGELKNRTRRTDQLLKVAKAGRQGLQHIEVQSREDRDIEHRLLEYNLMAMLTYDLPVISYLILLRPMAYVPVSPLITLVFDEIETWRFHYRVIKLWEIPAEHLVRSGLTGVLPLVPLVHGGTEMEALTTVVNELYAAGEYELLSLTRLIAGLVMKQPMQQDMLRRMFAMYRDIIEESWVYQEILREGMEKGADQGLSQGLERGLNQGLALGEQRALLAIIQKRFPDVEQVVRQLISKVTDPNLLESLIADVSVAQTSQEALEVLSVLDGHTNGRQDTTGSR